MHHLLSGSSNVWNGPVSMFLDVRLRLHSDIGGNRLAPLAMNAKTSLVVVWFHESEREISDGSWKRQSKT